MCDTGTVWDLFGTKKRRRRRELWATVAADLGGTFSLKKRFWSGGPNAPGENERIDAVVSGIPIVLDTYVVSTGNTVIPYSRVSARAAHEPAPAMNVQREGVIARLGKAIGVRDIELGVAEFDRIFVVKGDDVAAVRRVWTPRCIELMLTSFQKATLVSKAGHLKLTMAVIWDSEAVMRAAIALVSELAARDVFGERALRAIADAEIVHPSGSRPHAELALPARVVIQAEDAGTDLVMVARAGAEVGAALDPLDLTVTGGTVLDAERANVLPQAAHVVLREVGTGQLVRDADGVRFSWSTLELDPARLHAGARLVGAVASAHAGAAYR